MTSDIVEIMPSVMSVEQSVATDNSPSPLDFANFLPWACRQLCLQHDVCLKKVLQTDMVSIDRTKSRIGKSRLFLDNSSSGKLHTHWTAVDNNIEQDDSIIDISINYQTENMIEGLTFNKNKEIPRTILKLITLIIKWHHFFRFITITKGLNKGAVYELSKMLKVSNISEVKLDGNFVAEGNYDILLNSGTKLKHLSLSRCSINDDVVKKIADKLTYPAPAHAILMILNLSTNKITDIGAEYLAHALGRNIKLTYLNLAGNMISEKGVNLILNSMLEFPLTTEEIIEVRTQKLVYAISRNELVKNIAMELWLADQDKKRDNNKNKKPVKGKGQSVFDDSTEKSAGHLDIDATFYTKAKVIAETRDKEFEHPFSDNKTYHKNNYVYAKGNHTLIYLNLAYNNLSHTSVKKLLEVLQYQKMLSRKPKGLINVVIEGIPVGDCQELHAIDQSFAAKLSYLEKRPSMMKRRNSVKR